MSFLERLRNKSEKTRRRIALSVALVVTMVVVILWSFSVPSKISKVEEGKKIETSQVASPIGSFVNIFKSSFEQLKSQF